MRFENNEFYVKTPEEMAELFRLFPRPWRNTIEIAERCNLELDFKTYHFPQYEKPADKSLDEALAEQARPVSRSASLLSASQRPGFTPRTSSATASASR
jgi:DNA polymerase III alpha subunit